MPRLYFEGVKTIKTQKQKIKMLADIVEHALSGQYGRDTAEEIAEECLDALEKNASKPKNKKTARETSGYKKPTESH